MNLENHGADGAPRYQQLSALLASEIEQGRYPVGTLLPPEPLLCERFAVSRHTLREAVRRLCEQGLVTRRQGIGTRVVAQRSRSRFIASIGSLQELMQYTQGTRLKVLAHRPVKADGRLAGLLRCDEGERWLEIETCRFPVESDQPLVHMRVYVRPGSERVVQDLEGGDAWVFGLVERHGGERIFEAHQVVGAIAISAASARVLGVRAGAPGLLVRRYYLGRHGRLLSVSLNVYPADRFELSTRWRLTQDAEGHADAAAD